MIASIILGIALIIIGFFVTVALAVSRRRNARSAILESIASVESEEEQ